MIIQNILLLLYRRSMNNDKKGNKKADAYKSTIKH